MPGVSDRRRDRDRIYIRALSWLGRRGRWPLELAVRLDLLRALRPAAALGRLRGEARTSAPTGDGIRPGYRRLWTEAAEQIGAQISDPGDGFLEIRRGDRRTRVWNSWVGIDDAVTLRFADSKTRSRSALAAAGLPVPDQEPFELADLQPALEFLAALDGPCVIKPADAAGGSGATTGVLASDQLQRACLRAGRLSRHLLIEAQVVGDLYRILVLEGEVIGVIRRDPPRVVGDGRSTVAELVAAENERRVGAGEGARTGLLRIDLDAVFCLQNQGLRPSSVLADGERVAVKTVVNQNGPDDNVNARDHVSEELLADAVAAAGVIGVRLAGVDLITADPSRSLREGGGAIIEVNGTPGLHYHYNGAGPQEQESVAVAILERALAGGSQSG